MRFRVPIALLSGLAVFAGVVPAASATPVTAPAPHPCATATEPCAGRLDVPLDWHAPSSERISVSFRWYPRGDRTSPPAGTVLVIPGGPTAALPLAEVYRRMLGPALRRRDMLIVDPRGLGESTPLTCPGHNLDDPKDIGRCARLLGDRVQWFTSDQAAADLDAVRAALGVPEVTVYGGSYGTLWAQAYAARFPARVRAMLLHDVVRTGPDGYAQWPLGTAVRAGRANLDTVCRPSRACRAIAGTPTGNWARLVESLRANPDPRLPVPTLVTLPLFTGSASGRELNAAVAAYLRGDPAPLHRLAGPPAPALSGAGLTPGYFAYVCADAAHPYRRDAAPDQRRRELDAAYAEHNPFAPFTVNQIRGTRSDDLTHEDCLDWPTPRPSPPVPPGSPYPDTPVLTVGGTFDSATPLANAIAVADRFPRGRVAVNHFGAHSPELAVAALGLTAVYWRCAQDTVRSFVDDPARRQSGCDAENYRAIGSFPARATDLPAPPGVGAGAPVLAAAFATAADAIARRNPNAIQTTAPAAEPGLRGGHLTLPDPNTAHLSDIRYVSDVTVNGEIHLDHQATATLTATTTSGTHHITLSWDPFSTRTSTTVTGTIDSRPFHTQFRVS